jgi:hypothetical protein
MLLTPELVVFFGGALVGFLALASIGRQAVDPTPLVRTIQRRQRSN